MNCFSKVYSVQFKVTDIDDSLKSQKYKTSNDQFMQKPFQHTPFDVPALNLNSLQTDYPLEKTLYILRILHYLFTNSQKFLEKNNLYNLPTIHESSNLLDHIFINNKLAAHINTQLQQPLIMLRYVNRF